MGLGPGFQMIIEKEKDKDKDRDKPHDKPWSRHKERSERDDGDRRNTDEHEAHAGWTAMLEDWLCQGNGQWAARGTGSPTVADISFPKPLSPRVVSSKEGRRGPYQLLCKERMMGIYLAVYIHRDIRPLVMGLWRISYLLSFLYC